VKPGTLIKRARAEGWAAAREGRGAKRPAGSAGDDVQVARRTRKALLLMLERTAASAPGDATEVKTTEEGGAVKLLKLRDLTAAYKELAGDLPAETAGGESRVVVDL